MLQRTCNEVENSMTLTLFWLLTHTSKISILPVSMLEHEGNKEKQKKQP